MQRFLRLSGRLTLGFGFALLGGAVCALAYGEILERYQSAEFERTLEAGEETNAPGGMAGATGTLAEIGFETGLGIRRGDPVGKLEIPRLGLSVMVLHGVESDVLSVGAGLVPGTPLPGAQGNTAIAAHRDTFFRSLKDIRADDVIRISTARGTYQYAVESIAIVGPEDTSVLESRARPELTLITCYPFYFVGAAPERFIVRARYLPELG